MTTARLLGIVVQSIVMGTLLALAIGRLLALGSGARIFQYQAF